MTSPSTFEVNQMFVSWLEGDAFTQYTGYITEVNEENYAIDHPFRRNPLT